VYGARAFEYTLSEVLTTLPVPPTVAYPSKFSNVIAFIIPRSFRKTSIQNKLNSNYINHFSSINLPEPNPRIPNQYDSFVSKYKKIINDKLRNESKSALQQAKDQIMTEIKFSLPVRGQLSASIDLFISDISNDITQLSSLNKQEENNM
jgi:hypothetical protein